MSMPVMHTNCASCPFRDNAPDDFKNVRPLLEMRALEKATPICHSTGPDALVPKRKRVHATPHACRGARDLQLQVFHGLGFLAEPTDACWQAKCKEMGLLR